MTNGYNDEIDIRPYVLALFRDRWRISLVTILLPILILGLTFIQPRGYQGEATLVLNRNRETLSLSEQFRTLNEPIDSRSRFDAILTIARSDNIPQRIIDNASSSSPLREFDLEGLKDRVSITNNGDAILITATANDPVTAAEIANQWAFFSAQVINAAYREGPPLSDIQKQNADSKTAYEKSQQELEAFIASNNITILTKQVDEAQELLTRLISQRARQIAFYDEQKLSLEQLIFKAETLKNQLVAGNTSVPGDVGDALAVVLARAFAMGLTPEQGVQLQFSDFSGLRDENGDYVADLEAIISNASAELDRAESILETLVGDVTQGELSSMIEETSKKIRQYETQLEQEQARNLQLSSERDLAWATYQALVKKELEILNAAQTDNIVSFASEAIIPDMPLPRASVAVILFGALGGLMIGVAFSLGAHWWRSSGS